VNESTYDDPIMQKFRDIAAETVFDALWTRPGLDLKTRTLVCVVFDAARLAAVLQPPSQSVLNRG
jgi:4-carboxymuconolactone decarboxylase